MSGFSDTNSPPLDISYVEVVIFLQLPSGGCPGYKGLVTRLALSLPLSYPALPVGLPQVAHH